MDGQDAANLIRAAVHGVVKKRKRNGSREANVAGRRAVWRVVSSCSEKRATSVASRCSRLRAHGAVFTRWAANSNNTRKLYAYESQVWRTGATVAPQVLAEERFDVRGEGGHGWPPATQRSPAAATSVRQLRRGLKVPIGGHDADVPQIGGQRPHRLADLRDRWARHPAPAPQRCGAAMERRCPTPMDGSRVARTSVRRPRAPSDKPVVDRDPRRRPGLPPVPGDDDDAGTRPSPRFAVSWSGTAVSSETWSSGSAGRRGEVGQRQRERFRNPQPRGGEQAE